MKKLIFTILIIHFSLIIANAQWYQQNSGTNQNLYDVKFINKNTGWALGDAGIVLKTTNGGINWINIPNPSIIAGGILSTVFPVDSNFVYVVGGHEVILKTTNGGNNWITIRNGPYGTGTGFESAYFLNKDTGWFCGSYRVLRTTNGGMTFDSAGIFWGSLHDIYFKDFNTGVICGDGIVFKTTDGGLNWFNSNVPTNGHYPMFRRFGYAEKKYLWVAGYNASVFFRSTDFASTWSKVDSTRGGFGIFFLNKDTGFVGSGLNQLLKTTNGGYNWKRERTDTNVLAFISAICFASDSLGWYVGAVGKIYYTSTGGLPLVINSINSGKIPKNYELYQNYPNPFNTQTNIEFDITESGIYKLDVFDLLGRKIKEIFNKDFKPGRYRIKYDAENLTSGTYFYRLQSKKMSRTKSFLFIK